MSYVVTIARRQGTPLTLDEIVKAIGTEGDFEPFEPGQTRGAWRWRGTPAGSDMAINVEPDHLWTDGGRDWTTGAAIARLQQLARQLGADVTGEEGEDLNHVAAPMRSEPVKPQGMVSASLSLLLMVPVLLVSAIAWAGWALWKLVRRR